MNHYRIGLSLLLVAIVCGAARAEPFELRDGDRVVLVGNTFIEREQRYSQIEAALTRRFADREVTFRNLGWSGDDVFGTSRGVFEVNQRNVTYSRLVGAVKDAKPTVIIVNYGSNAAFDGEPSLADFMKQYTRLLDDLKATNARLVVVAPLKQENMGAPLPDPAAYNRSVALYASAIKKAAEERGATYLELSSLIQEGGVATSPLTSNGVHLTHYGYWRAAQAALNGLSVTTEPWSVAVDTAARKATATGTTVTNLTASNVAVQFTARDTVLPPPLPPRNSPTNAANELPARIVKVTGLAKGRYTLTIDDQPIATANEAAWAKGVSVAGGPEYLQSEHLREAIVQKNTLFFYRWRPQNETYLFLFRKHEQGQNAKEIPQFDPLVESKEREIATLRKPAPHVYELSKTKGGE